MRPVTPEIPSVGPPAKPAVRPCAEAASSDAEEAAAAAVDRVEIMRGLSGLFNSTSELGSGTRPTVMLSKAMPSK